MHECKGSERFCVKAICRLLACVACHGRAQNDHLYVAGRIWGKPARGRMESDCRSKAA